MKILYFTGTGNSLYVAKKLGGELLSIPKLLNSNEHSIEDDKIGLVFPCYAHAAPEIVLEFIRKVKLNSPYIFVIMTYGCVIGSSLGDFVSYARNQGIEISYSNIMLMIDNYLPFFDLDKEKKKDKHIDESLANIINDIATNKENNYQSSFFASLITRIAHAAERFLPPNSPEQFSVNSDCNHCGVCVQVCPRKNITLDNDSSSSSPEFGSLCEFCLACANLCPQKAIKLRTDKNPNARFQNEGVSLKEIIDSNN